MIDSVVEGSVKGKTEDAAEVPEQSLIERYVATRDPEVKEALILKYMHLVRYVIGRISISLPPSLEADDLIGAGILGLINAIEAYDPSYHTKLSTYAVPRIKGAILDELRAMDWVPRSVRSKARDLENTLGQLAHKLGRSPSAREVADELNMQQEEYQNLLDELGPMSMLPLSYHIAEDSDQRYVADVEENFNPMAEIEKEEARNIVADAIESLPERERLVVALYYYEDLTLKEMGRVMGVSESRVSQIHTEAILKLRGRIRRAMLLQIA